EKRMRAAAPRFVSWPGPPAGPPARGGVSLVAPVPLPVPSPHLLTQGPDLLLEFLEAALDLTQLAPKLGPIRLHLGQVSRPPSPVVARDVPKGVRRPIGELDLERLPLTVSKHDDANLGVWVLALHLLDQLGRVLDFLSVEP